MSSLRVRKSSPRLRIFSYEGPYAYLLTINTYQRKPWFRDAQLVKSCQKELLRLGDQLGFKILAYCFMPDHLHLLIQGSDNSRLIPFIQKFKQLTGYRFKASTQERLWQRSFYDHVLRGEEDLGEVANYVWDNPVRAGLIESRHDYLFSGPFGQT